MILPLKQSQLQPSPQQRDNYEPAPANQTLARAAGRINRSWKQGSVILPVAHSWSTTPCPKTSLEPWPTQHLPCSKQHFQEGAVRPGRSLDQESVWF